jgi:hypothetical protein
MKDRSQALICPFLVSPFSIPLSILWLASGAEPICLTSFSLAAASFHRPWVKYAVGPER